MQADVPEVQGHSQLYRKLKVYMRPCKRERERLFAVYDGAVVHINLEHTQDLPKIKPVDQPSIGRSLISLS